MSIQKSRKETALEYIDKLRELIVKTPEMDFLKITFSPDPDSMDVTPGLHYKANKAKIIIEYECKVEVDV